MKIMTLRQLIVEYIGFCRADRPSDDPRRAEYLGKRKQVAALDPNTATADDIERIIGAQGGFGWGRLYECDECKKQSPGGLVEFASGDRGDYDTQIVHLCPSCLQSALNSVSVQVLLEANRSQGY
jgi:hypothetical protein